LSSFDIQDPRYLHASGITYLQCGENENAHTQLSKLINIIPNQHGIINAVADLKSKMKLVGAEALFQESIQLSPNTSQYYYNFALHFKRQNDYNQSKLLLNKALSVSSSFEQAYKELIKISLLLEEYQEAMIHLNQLEVIKKDIDWQFYIFAATVSEQSKKFSKSCEFYQKAIEHKCDKIEPYEGLVLNNIILGNIGSAIEWSLKAISKFPKDIQIINLHTNLAIEYDLEDPLAILEEKMNKYHMDSFYQSFIKKALNLDLADKAMLTLKSFEKYYQAYENYLVSFCEVQKYLKNYQSIENILEDFNGSNVNLLEFQVIASMALGHYHSAKRTIDILLKLDKNNQYYKALNHTYLKATDMSKYQSTQDLSKLVHRSKLLKVDGYSDINEFNNDLKNELIRLHVMKTHPINQSARGGTQTPGNIFERLDAPLVKKLYNAISIEINKKLNGLGSLILPFDDFRNDRCVSFKFQAAWSMWLNSGGHHLSHCHSKGWYSGVYYVDVPNNLNLEKNEGAIHFGVPGIETKDKMLPDLIFNPIQSDLVLFPSMLWHGTIPFKSDQPRIVIAFDIIPNV